MKTNMPCQLCASPWVAAPSAAHVNPDLNPELTLIARLPAGRQRDAAVCEAEGARRRARGHRLGEYRAHQRPAAGNYARGVQAPEGGVSGAHTDRLHHGGELRDAVHLDTFPHKISPAADFAASGDDAGVEFKRLEEEFFRPHPHRIHHGGASAETVPHPGVALRKLNSGRAPFVAGCLAARARLAARSRSVQQTGNSWAHGTTRFRRCHIHLPLYATGRADHVPGLQEYNKAAWEGLIAGCEDAGLDQSNFNLPYSSHRT